LDGLCWGALWDGLGWDAPRDGLCWGAAGDGVGDVLRGEFMTGLLLPPLDRGLEYC
jgi:hypothetical protein